MAMTWQSLMNLKQNLGDVGESVVGYLQGRQKERQQQRLFDEIKGKYEQFRTENPNANIGDLGSYFAGGQPTPAGAVELYGAMRKATAPGMDVRSGGEGDIVGLPTKGGIPTGGATTPLYTNPNATKKYHDVFGTTPGIEDQMIARQLGIDMTKEPTQVQATEFLQKKNALYAGRSGAAAGAGAAARSPFEIAREKREAEAKRKLATASAVELGKQFEPLDSKIGELKYYLNVRPKYDKETGDIIEGQYVDRQGKPASAPPTEFGSKDEMKIQLQELMRQKTQLEENLRKKKAEAAGQPIGQAQTIKMPFGDVTIEELPRG